MRKPRVYVSGPMAGAPGSSYMRNIHVGINAAEALERLECVPYLPHTNMLWGILFPDKDLDTIISRDLAWVSACDAVVRLPGASHGSDLETAHADNNDIPVFRVRLEAGNYSGSNGAYVDGEDRVRFADWLRAFRREQIKPETVKS